MKNKTIILLFIIIFFIVYISCEKDDLCIKSPVTPNLILRFYDSDNKEELKSVEKLYIWSEGKDSIFNGVSTDSISLPLNSLTTQTVYKISDGTNINILTIEYTIEEEYVSRSCGFKIIYKDLILTSNNIWFSEITPTTLKTITSQDAAHVQIYH